MENRKGKKVARILLGSFLVVAGISHLTFARKAFKAQVPDWVPLEKDKTVVYSGFTEIALGSALIFTDKEHKKVIGNIVSAFFIAVFPGNISQYINKRNAFGLDTDNKRFARLFFQPLLVYWSKKGTH